MLSAIKITLATTSACAISIVLNTYDEHVALIRTFGVTELKSTRLTSFDPPCGLLILKPFFAGYVKQLYVIDMPPLAFSFRSLQPRCKFYGIRNSLFTFL